MGIPGLKFLDGIIDKIPLQGRVERWKNERDSLKEEKVKLERVNYDVNKAEDRKKLARLTYVRNRIPELEQLLINYKS